MVSFEAAPMEQLGDLLQALLWGKRLVCITRHGMGKSVQEVYQIQVVEVGLDGCGELHRLKMRRQSDRT